MTRPDNPMLSTHEGEALMARLAVYAPTPADCELLMQVLRMYFWLVWTVQEAKLSLKRLRSVLFGKALSAPQAPGAAPEAVATVPEPPTPRPAEASSSPSDNPPVPSGPATAAPSPKPRGGHRPGTGRLGEAAYPGAARAQCRHEELAAGQRCPVCGQGTLYALPPGVEIRVDGNALLSALRYEVEKLRCSACGEIFTASLPPAAGEEKYSARARAVVVLSRYYLGVPLYRLQGYQAMLGVPLPDATQWDQIEKVADCSYVVFEHLERLAAQGELIYQDDTAVRILSLREENLQRRAHAEAMGFTRSQERTGMYTTALVVKVGDQTIYLYYSGRRHAGENLAALLAQRQAGAGTPLVMSDALASNEADESRLIRCHCLAHGRRKFQELDEIFPQECHVVLEVLKQVFDHDEQARADRLSPAARVAYHQAMSRPIMEGLKKWLDQQRDDRLVEPNSSLGKAMAYMQTHWVTLTRFLSVPGAPLDNNVVERALKLFIRQRKNSLFYRTEHSAYIASILTSVIATCLQAGVNALDYLVALQEHRREVFATPAAWLPWTYAASRASP